MENEIFKQEISAYVKQNNVLISDIKMSYSLILGQCTDLMKYKLCNSTQWKLIATNQDSIELLRIIKDIIYQFDNKKYVALAIHNMKVAFYDFWQSPRMNNSDYLSKFRNLADIASSLKGNLHDDAISTMVCERDHNTPDFLSGALNSAQKEAIKSNSR